MKFILTALTVLSSPPKVKAVASTEAGVTIRVMPFPIHRLRRLRANEPLRAMVRETRLDPAQFVLPLSCARGKG